MLTLEKEADYRFYPFLVALLLLTLFIYFLPLKNVQLSNDDFNASMHSHKISDLADSTLLLKKAFETDGAYYILNSSHLTTFSIPTHPAYFFHNSTPAFLIGGGGHQNLLNVLNIASLQKDLSNKKIVIILSSQWFSDQEGISKGYFNRWFHEIQLFETLENPFISDCIKARIANRLMEMDYIKTDPILSSYLFAKKYSLNSLQRLLSPFINLQKNSAIKKENTNLKRVLSEPANLAVPENANGFEPGKDFSIMYKLATDIGQKETSNNIFGISNGYYNTYISKKKPRPFKGGGLLTSKEYDDLKLFCELLKELKAQPMFIILPMHGKWLDSRGFALDKREEFYHLIRSTVSVYGFAIGDFSKYEYEKFFLSDIMHIGWIGWLRVNEKIREFYEKI